MKDNNTRNILISAGLAVGVGTILLWPRSKANASTGNRSQGAAGQPRVQTPLPPTPKPRTSNEQPFLPEYQSGTLVAFPVKGTQIDGWQDVRIGAVSRTQKTHEGTVLQGFTAPDAYASNNTWFLEANALSALRQVQDNFVQEGKSIVIVDAFRTLERQRQLAKEKPHLATAVATNSNHPKGLALDLRLYDPNVSKVWDEGSPDTWGDQGELAREMERLGWRQHSDAKEPWHFDYVG